MRVGKLGEIAFAKFLSDHGKALLGTEDMFTVWSDTHTVDAMDFQTTDGKTIDVKTASRDFHKNILVPYDQYKRQPKDYYVGVRYTCYRCLTVHNVKSTIGNGCVQIQLPCVDCIEVCEVVILIVIDCQTL